MVAPSTAVEAWQAGQSSAEVACWVSVCGCNGLEGGNEVREGWPGTADEPADKQHSVRLSIGWACFASTCTVRHTGLRPPVSLGQAMPDSFSMLFPGKDD